MINRLGVGRSVLGCGFALLVSCGGDHPGAFIDVDGNGGSSATGNRPGVAGSAGRTSAGGRGGASGASGTGGASGAAGSSGKAEQGGSDSPSDAAPVIEITNPVAAEDPNSDSILVDDQVTVLCTVKNSSATSAKPVDPSTVKLAAYDADGKQLKSVAGATTSNDSEYSATFVLTALPSGPVSFSCSANDTAQPVHSGMATVATLVDQGPEITIIEPADKSAHNLLGPMNIEFEVAPLSIAEGDKQGAISSTRFLIGGVEIATVEKSKGHYQASVDFTDKSLFNSEPTGVVPITIEASNSRKKPGKATRTLAYGITVDGDGPTIVLGTPAASAVVGPASVMTFNVSDAVAGVDRETVAVKLNEETKLFSATDGLWTWADGSGAFSFKIGAALAKNAADTQVTVNVLAKDRAGNASTGNSRIYSLDNQPPTVDLDPPGVYEMRAVTTSDMKKQCSDLFDPLGAFDSSLPKYNGSPNDLSTILNFGQFRALVWDQTNTKAGQSDPTYALTDKDSVRFYVQPNTDFPLLADDDKDGVCDEIWTGSVPHQLHPTDKPLPFLKLSALAPSSSNTSPVYSAANQSNDPLCGTGGPATGFVRLCGAPGSGVSDMAVVVRHGTSDVLPFEPVVYVSEPDPDTASSNCAGKPWEIAAAIKTNDGAAKLGWVCIAARALDKVGNPGISPPLRVCVSDENHPDPCKDVPPPSCTDSCTPPPHFKGGLVKHF